MRRRARTGPGDAKLVVLPGGPHEIGTRDGFGDLGITVAALLGVEVEGLVGRAFTDRLGLREAEGSRSSEP